MLFYFPGDRNWWFGSLSGTQLIWRFAGNTSGFGQVWDKRPFWTGRFSRSGRTELLFYHPGDGNWWLGSFTNNLLQWSHAGNTSGATAQDPNFGDLTRGTVTFSTGGLADPDRTDLMFHHADNWWSGSYAAGKIRWTLAADTSRNEGFVAANLRQIWAADFSGDSRVDLLYRSPRYDGRWWVGSMTDWRLNWSLVHQPAPPDPGPTPPPVQMTTVPDLTGQRLAKAKEMVLGAQLRLGSIDNFTGTSDESALVVSWQSLVPGSRVDVGSSINLAVSLAETTQGLKTLRLYNCSTDRTPIRVWSFDRTSGSWTKIGDLDPQFNYSICPYPGTSPISVHFNRLAFYTVVAVKAKPETGCRGDETGSSRCVLWFADVLGNPKGQTLAHVISGGTGNQKAHRASATPMPGVQYRISTLNGRVLGIANDSCSDGASAVATTRHGGDIQRWRFDRLADGSYVVVNKASHLVLEVEGGPTATSRGARVRQSTNRAVANQRWQVEDAGGGAIRLLAPVSGLVLDVPDTPRSEIGLRQWHWSNSANQRFLLEALTDDIEPAGNARSRTCR